jgi:citrate synthase
MSAPTVVNEGLEGVAAGTTALSYIDAARGRLLYRGYRIGDVIERGTYAQVAELLWTGNWPVSAFLPPERIPHPWRRLGAGRQSPAGGRPPVGI